MSDLRDPWSTITPVGHSLQSLTLNHHSGTDPREVQFAKYLTTNPRLVQSLSTFGWNVLGDKGASLRDSMAAFSRTSLRKLDLKVDCSELDLEKGARTYSASCCMGQ